MSRIEKVNKPRKERSAEPEKPESKHDTISPLFTSVRKRKCPTTDDVAVTGAIPGDMARVITRLDGLQASIDRLLGICLQVEPDDSSEEKPVFKE